MKRRNPIARSALAAIEMLEQRRLLSSSVQSTLVPNGDGTNTLRIEGTKNGDHISVYDDPANNFIEVFNDKNHNGKEDSGELTPFADANVTVVHIDTKQGDDCVQYELVSSYDDSQRSIEVDLSSGYDKFTFFSPTQDKSADSTSIDTSGADILNHSDINMEIEGQEGNDTIDINLSRTSIISSEVLVNVDAGSGNDCVSFEAPNFSQNEQIGGLLLKTGATPAIQQIGGFTELQVEIDLGSGTNHYTQDMYTNIIDADVTITVNGGNNYDKVQDCENFELLDDSTYNLTVNLNGGNDYYNGEYDFNPISGINIERGSTATINLQGGEGNDRITVEGEDFNKLDGQVNPAGVTVGSGIDGVLNVNAYGGNGNDTLDMFTDTDHALYIPTSCTGRVHVVLSGDYGNDDVRLFLGATEDSTGDYDLSVLGAAGNDTVGAGFADQTLLNLQPTAQPADTVPVLISDVTFGPRNAILLDGGRDYDKYDTEAYSLNGVFLTPFDVRAVECLNEKILLDLPALITP